jgi:hypothetical protein
MDSRLDYRLNQSPSCQSPTKDVYRTLDRFDPIHVFSRSQLGLTTIALFCRSNPLHYATVETPFLRESLQKRSVRGPGGGVAGHSARFEKGLASKRLSWRCLAVFFIVMALILAAALAYVTGTLPR